jgi:membrane associated rhomboid family serine protease
VRGFVDHRVLDVVVGLAIGAYYGTSILWGVLPVHTGVSWQGHLFGLIAGVTAAYLFRERPAEVAAGG